MQMALASFHLGLGRDLAAGSLERSFPEPAKGCSRPGAGRCGCTKTLDGLKPQLDIDHLADLVPTELAC